MKNGKVKEQALLKLYKNNVMRFFGLLEIYNLKLLCWKHFEPLVITYGGANVESNSYIPIRQ